MQLYEVDFDLLDKFNPINQYNIISDDGLYKKTWMLLENKIKKTINGSILNDIYIGDCIMTYNNNSIIKYIGKLKYQNNEYIKEGYGIELYSDGNIYHGEFKNDVKHGKGKMYFNNMTLKNDGYWENNVLVGKTIGYMNIDNYQYFGEIENEKPNGIGCLINKTDNKINEISIWDDNKIILTFPFNDNYHYVLENMDVIKIKNIYNDFKHNMTIEKLYILKEYLIPINIDKINIHMYTSNDVLVYNGDMTIINNKYLFNGNGLYKLNDYVFNGIFNKHKFIHGMIMKNKILICSGKFDIDINNINGDIDFRKYLIEGEVICKFKKNPQIECEYKFIGKLLNNTISQGTLININENVKLYEGEFNTNCNVFDSLLYPPYSGFGQEYYANGKVKYDGNWANGKYNGEGCLYNSITYNLEYSGNFRDDMKHGDGILFDIDGNQIYEGRFNNNEF